MVDTEEKQCTSCGRDCWVLKGAYCCECDDYFCSLCWQTQGRVFDTTIDSDSYLCERCEQKYTYTAECGCRGKLVSGGCLHVAICKDHQPAKQSLRHKSILMEPSILKNT